MELEVHELFVKAPNQPPKLRVYQNQTSTGPKRTKTVHQGNTGVRQGQVDSMNDSGIFNCTAYNRFGKPDSREVYMNVACEYMVNALEKLLLNRDALSIYLVCFNMCYYLLVLMFMACFQVPRGFNGLPPST